MKAGREGSIIFGREGEKEDVNRSLVEICDAIASTLAKIEYFKSHEGFDNQNSRNYYIAKEKSRLEDLTVVYEKWKNNITQKLT